MLKVVKYIFAVLFFCGLLQTVRAQGDLKVGRSETKQQGIEKYFQVAQNQLVTLQPNGSWIWLTDYVMDYSQLDSVTSSPGLSLGLSEEKAIAVARKAVTHVSEFRRILGKQLKQDSIFISPWEGNKLEYIQLWKGGKSCLVPVRLSEKVWKVFRIPADEQQYKKVQIKGTFNAWNANNLNLVFEPLQVGKALPNKGFWMGGTWVGPGMHQYVIVADGKELRDPSNPDSISNGMGGWNSTFTNATSNYHLQHINYQSAFIDGTTQTKKEENTGGLTQFFTFVVDGVKPLVFSESIKVISPPKSGKKVQKNNVVTKSSGNAGSVIAVWQNVLLPTTSITFSVNGTSQRFTLSISEKVAIMHGFNTGYGFLKIWYSDKNGVSNEVLIPMKDGKMIQSASELSPKDPHKMIIYNPMIDRFVDGNPGNNKPLLRTDVNPKVDFYGGDVVGITQKIKEGYFTALGVNTLWISPVVKNPQGPYGQWVNPPTKFSGYHGYWPVSLKQTDERFCTEAELKEFIDVAHANGMQVLIDYVAHHIHQEHPLYKQKPDWFTPLILPDGSKNTERWDDYRLTTWFDDFMPTFNYFKPEVVDALTDTAIYWFHHYPVDGFRHDATKHIPDAFWRKLTLKMKQQVLLPSIDAGSPRNIYQIGETYGSAELIGSYLGSGLLDAQFDFNMYDAAVNAFKSNKGMNQLATTLSDSRKWYGAHHLMGNISGNQDKPRIISLLDGSIKEGENAKQAGWDRDIQINDSLGYSRLLNMMAFNFLIPGIPVIYYGDEIGMPGANDPDSRRFMRFEKGLQGSVQSINKKEMYLRNQISTLTNVRANNMALIYGNMLSKSFGDSVLLIDRSYGYQNIIGIINNGRSDVYVAISMRENNHVSDKDFQIVRSMPVGTVAHATAWQGREGGIVLEEGNIYPQQKRAEFGYNSLMNRELYLFLPVKWWNQAEVKARYFVIKVPANSFDYLIKN